MEQGGDIPDDARNHASEDAGEDATEGDQLLAELTGVLEPLWRIGVERPGKPCSLARLSKQSQRAMSILRRQLTVLEMAGLAVVTQREDGSGDVALTAAGAELCASLFAADAP